MGVIKILLKWIIGSFLLVQIISLIFISFPENKPTDRAKEIKAPAEIMAMLKVSCYDCHSNSTNYPWYKDIVPFSYGINRHVDLGRKWLNFSIWEEYTPEQKDEKLGQIFKSVHTVMPLSSYVKMHPEATLSKEQRDKIRAWTGKAPF